MLRPAWKRVLCFHLPVLPASYRQGTVAKTSYIQTSQFAYNRFEHAACDPPSVSWASQGSNEFHGHADTRNAARTGGHGSTSDISSPRTKSDPHSAARLRDVEDQHASE